MDELEDIETIKAICENINSNLKDLKGGYIQKNQPTEVIHSLAELQGKLEYAYESVKRFKNEVNLLPFIERMERSINEVKEILNSRDEIGKKYRLYFSTAHGIFTDIGNENYNPAYHSFIVLQSLVLGFGEDYKLVRKLIIFPIEKKTEVKNKLSNYKLFDVLKPLEEAEQNIIDKHPPKDCVDRCREALSKMVEKMVDKINEKISQSFEANLSTLLQREIIDRGLKIDFVGFQTYLAKAGLHAEVKPENIDVNYVLNETYLKISRMLQIMEKSNDATSPPSHSS